MVRTIAVVLGALLLAAAPMHAQEAVLSQFYGSGVHAYFAADYVKAHDELTAAVNGGSSDPRVFYFRGLSYIRLGRPEEADLDFQKGAELEAKDVNKFYNVSKALERVQGFSRSAVEKHRVSARMAAFEQTRKMQQDRYEAQRAADRENALRPPTEPAMPAVPGEPAEKPVEKPAVSDDPFNSGAGPKPVEPKAPATEPGPAAPPAEKPAATDDPFNTPAQPKPEAMPAEQPKPEEKPAATDDPFSKPATPPAEKPEMPAPVTPEPPKPEPGAVEAAPGPAGGGKGGVLGGLGRAFRKGIVGDSGASPGPTTIEGTEPAPPPDRVTPAVPMPAPAPGNQDDPFGGPAATPAPQPGPKPAAPPAVADPFNEAPSAPPAVKPEPPKPAAGDAADPFKEEKPAATPVPAETKPAPKKPADDDPFSN